MHPVKPAPCIVVPGLDEGPDLAMQLGELQRLRKRGTLVVDAGSSDTSAASAADLADLAFGAPQGRARQMNAGAAACTADLLIICVRMDLFDPVGEFPDQPMMEGVALSTPLKRHGPPAGPREPVTTSARPWEQHGRCRTNLLMWRLRAAHCYGAYPSKLPLRDGYRPPPP